MTTKMRSVSEIELQDIDRGQSKSLQDARQFMVSVHVPKTAGTTLAQVMDRVFNRRVLYDYDGYERPTEADPAIQANATFVSSYFASIHGHFYARKYFDVFPDASYVAVVRHPVERVISQYIHEFTDGSSQAWYHDAIKSGRMDVVEFAAQPGVGDAMSLHLEGRPLSAYALLLLTEDMWTSVHLLARMVRPFSVERHFGSSLPRSNEARIKRETLNFDERTKISVYEKCKADNEVYKEASSLFRDHCKKYLEQ